MDEMAEGPRRSVTLRAVAVGLLLVVDVWGVSSFAE